MRYSTKWAGLGAVLVAISASIAWAGPLDRNATSKALGDDIGQTAQPRAGNRAYSYAPAPVVAAPSTTANAAPRSAVVQNYETNNRATRSYSYQPQTGFNRLNRPVIRTPRYTQADSKARGEY